MNANYAKSYKPLYAEGFVFNLHQCVFPYINM